MNNLINLIKGEMIRLIKYKIFYAGLVVSLIWVFIIGLSEKEAILELIPALLLMDAGLMSIILLSASFFLEKQEGTIKSVLVAPVKLSELLIAKIIASVITALISTILVVATAIIVHKLEINLFLLFIYILIVVISHVAIGLVITLFSKDFGGMLGLYMLYALIGLLPSVFFIVGIIPESLNDFLLISPTYAAQMLLNSIFVEGTKLYLIVIALGYLAIISVLLYLGVIYKKYKKYAIGG